MRRSSLFAVAFAVLTTSASAGAQVTQSMGAGSAVTSVSAAASFENQSALNDNPYMENGLRFSRTGLSFDNNGCGFAGCAGHTGFDGFSGNYMYGTGSGGFTMQAAIGQRFYGLEFMLGSGFGNQSLWNASWTALLNGTEVGSGSIAEFTPGQVVGFASANGFDELRYSDLNDGYNAPAFDEVRAQYATVVPEPSTWMLMASGLGMLAAYRRKRSHAKA